MRLDLIGANELKQYIGRRGYVIVDLRPKQDFNISHIPGAVNMPYEELDMEALSENTRYIFYCERGVKSMRVCRFLRERGIPAMAVVSTYSECARKM